MPGTVRSGAVSRPAGHAVRRLVAMFFVAHAIATMVGFGWPWRVAEPPSYDLPDESVLLLLGDPVRLAINVLWLLAGAGFLVAAWQVRHGSPGWRRVAAIAAAGSVGLCLVDWPAAVVGLVINAGVLALLWLTGRIQRRVQGA